MLIAEASSQRRSSEKAERMPTAPYLRWQQQPHHDLLFCYTVCTVTKHPPTKQIPGIKHLKPVSKLNLHTKCLVFIMKKLLLATFIPSFHLHVFS
jgi:hypothetical protein